MSADITAVSTHSTEPGAIHDVIRKHVSSCSLHLQRYKGGAHVPDAVWRVPRLQPVGGGAAAVVQVPSINKGTYIHIYQLVMSLLVIGFTYLEGRDGEILVKELAAVDSHSRSVSSYIFKRPYGWEELPQFNARMNEVITHGCNWNDGDVLYTELEIVLHREASSAVAIYCFGPLKTTFISGLIGRKIIDITQLGYPELADISLPDISCTFACHNKSRQVCALRTAYSLAQLLNYYTLRLQYEKCPPQPVFH
jgi:hypothetical protein